MNEQLRPSFAERDKYLDLLSAAYSDGRLDDEELDKRTRAVLGAVTHRDAIAQFEGLPAPKVLKHEPPPARPAPVAPPPPRPEPVVPPAYTLPEPTPPGPLYAIDSTPASFLPAKRSSTDGAGLVLKVVMGVAAAAIGMSVIGGFVSASQNVNIVGPWDGEIVRYDDPPDAWGDPLDEDGPPMFQNELTTDRIDDVWDELDSEGLTDIVRLRVTEDTVDGAALETPGEVAVFRETPDEPLFFDTPSEGNVTRAVPVDVVRVMFDNALSGAVEGIPTLAELVWTEHDEPALEVFFDVGDVKQIAWFDGLGNLVRVQER